ncbi:PLP-dependent transferase, partial [Sporormia fimetaria CBS 119925]
GLWITLSNGHKYLNGSGGAAVASLGYRHPAMVAAVCDPKDLQVGDELLYPSGDSLGFADDLVATTGGKMYAASLYNSGSDAVEAAIKLAVQTQNSRGQGHRSVFIARENSYHGATGGALNVSGHLNRRNGNHALLRMDVEFVSPCNTYRDMVPGETEEQYVDRLAQELEGVFAARLGEVVAMIAEPVVGAALGCMGAPKGYLKRMQQICHKHGALFIVDEVMCGSGRSGKTFHVWQQEEDFVPDIQTLGKGLTGGYEAVGVIMATREVHDLVRNTDGEVRHGQTFQCFPRACRAGRAAIREILPRLSHVEEMGKLLKAGLKANLASHRYVGDIRGSGLFVAIELVMDKMTKVPFHRNRTIIERLKNKALGPDYQVRVYHSTGCADGNHGDAIMLAPPYIITEEEVQWIVQRITSVVNDFFDE